MGKRGKAQVSMEYLLVVVFAFTIIVPLVLFFVSESQSATSEVNIAQIANIQRKIISNAEIVYAFGEPTTLTLRFYMPPGVDTVNLNNADLDFIVNKDGTLLTISQPHSMNLTGNISSHVGIHKLRFTASNNSVFISEN